MNGHSVLVFCATKNWCEKLAQHIAKIFRTIGKSFRNLINCFIVNIKTHDGILSWATSHSSNYFANMQFSIFLFPSKSSE
jgi:hypothetical protein